MNTAVLNDVQKIAYKLIQTDLSYIYTIFSNYPNIGCNYLVSMQPYLGIIADGAEDWVTAVEIVNKLTLGIPCFSEEEKIHYEAMRGNIKFWEKSYLNIFTEIKEAYTKSDIYFSNLCKPIAKNLKLYDIYGADIVNGEFCGNTILCSIYTPYFSYKTGEIVSDYIKNMSVICGEYIGYFNAMQLFHTDKTMNFSVKEYGGFIGSPVGNQFSEKFILFSILCQINFILLCIDKYIMDEIPTKLRFAYLLYFYLLQVLPSINQSCTSVFAMDNKWRNYKFRNAMAHYKLGMALKQEDIIESDLMGGLTNKIFGVNYIVIKDAIIHELSELANQIKEYLRL